MEIGYIEANDVAKECPHLKGMACEKRYDFRDCDRPLCCGFCPTVADCEDMCILIIEEVAKEKWGK